MDANLIYAELKDLNKKLEQYHAQVIANKNDIAWLKKIVSGAGAMYTGMMGYIALKYIKSLGG
jgi:GTPase involved in cell partitioning and DNA repair